MALVTSSSPAPSTSDPTAALTEALIYFQDILTDEQKRQYQNAAVRPLPSDVIAFVVEIDTNNQGRARRCVASRLCTFLDRTQQFASVVDMFVSARPTVAALIWGSIKFTIITASNVAAYFDKVTNMIMEISRSCPVYEQFGQLFTSSVELQRVLSEYYAIVVRLCIKIIEIIRRNTLTQFVSSLWNPFESEFKVFRDEFDQATKHISLHVSLTSKQVTVEAARLSALDREETRKNWSTLFASSSEIKQERKDAHQWRLRQSDRHKSKLKSSIRDNLSTVNHLKVWKHIHQQRAPCTAEWLHTNLDFLKWKEDEQTSVLWCPGILGVGKTVLLSHIVGHLQQSRKPNEIICHHFCRSEDSASLSARVVFGTIARQMLDIQIENLELAELTSLGRITRDLDVKELVGLLIPQLDAGVTYYVLIDGLDEVQREDFQNIKKCIEELCDKHPKNLKIFLSGRPELESLLFQRVKFNYKVPITKSGTTDDIERYLTAILDQHLEDQTLVLNDPKLVLKITEILKQNSEGIFLWTRLFVEEICAQQSDNEILRALNNPPRKISELINRKLMRVRKHDAANYAVKLLRYCSALKRPLDMDEHQELLSISIGQVEFDRGSLPSNMAEIITACCGLVYVDEEENTIHYTHHSIQQHLLASNGLDKDAINETELELYLGKLCLTYLNFNDFQRQITRQQAGYTIPLNPIQFSLTAMSKSNSAIASKSSNHIARALLRHRRQHKDLSTREVEQKMQELLRNIGPVQLPSKLQSQQYPFLRYASTHWISHLAYLDTDDGSGMWKLFCNCVNGVSSVSEKPWAKMENPQDSSTPNINETVDMCHWCVRNEHHALLTYIALHCCDAISEEVKQFILDNFKFSPHHRSISIVVKNMKCTNDTFLQGLLHAIRSGHMDCVKAFLNEFGYSSPAEYFNERGALLMFAGRGDSKAVEEILALGADVNTRNSNGWTALYRAASDGRVEVVAKLLAAGADVNAYDTYGKTTLYIAASIGCVEVVEKLLAAGANINTHDSNGWTALYRAATNGYVEVVEKLLAAGADVNAYGSNGWTALYGAAIKGHVEIVEKLLAAGADVNAYGSYGWTALHQAATSGYVEVVEKLLAAGADVNACNTNGWTALHEATTKGHVEVVGKLLAAGADINTRDNNEGTALYMAATNGHVEVVEKLLAAGADVNARDNKEWTALYVAAIDGYVEIVEKLLAAGADLNICNTRGDTALEVARRGDHKKVVRVLKAHGAHELKTSRANRGNAA